MIKGIRLNEIRRTKEQVNRLVAARISGRIAKIDTTESGWNNDVWAACVYRPGAIIADTVVYVAKNRKGLKVLQRHW